MTLQKETQKYGRTNAFGVVGWRLIVYGTRFCPQIGCLEEWLKWQTDT
jgi:hypothetical protein